MTENQRFYTLLGLVCEDFPHYAVEMAMDAGHPGVRQRLHDVKRGRTVDLPDLVALVRHSLPRFEIPAHLLPDGQLLSARIEAFIKELFLLYRLEKLEVSARWLATALSEGEPHRVEQYEVGHYLRKGRGLEPGSAPRRIRIPLEADYQKLDAQGRPTITTYHVELARPFTLLVQDWLTPEELQAFNSPLPEVVAQEAVAA